MKIKKCLNIKLVAFLFLLYAISGFIFMDLEVPSYSEAGGRAQFSISGRFQSMERSGTAYHYRVRWASWLNYLYFPFGLFSRVNLDDWEKIPARGSYDERVGW